MRTVLAGDLGGTKCRYALVGEDFSVHRVQHVATVRDRDEFLRGLDRAITAVLAELPPGLEPPRAAGFGTAGVVPADGASILQAPNLPLDGYPLAGHVAQRFGLPTTLLNDGRASAWGEFLRGNAAGRDPLLCLFFGTGVGIGLIVHGRPYGGGANAAGEIGHTTFAPGGRACPCGGRGHFEAYCGGRAITERAAAELGRPDGPVWTVGGVVAAADRTDPVGAAARTILHDAATAACTLVENACTLLNPAAVVLGGGVCAGWPALPTRIEAHVRQHCSEPIRRDLAFVPSLGGSDAILWGAAAATGALWPARG
ncbi:MAG: ROK family protein [Planctomycetes bacterium]|nr:ROK family protein [Planctomycetota bacterium]